MKRQEKAFEKIIKEILSLKNEEELLQMDEKFGMVTGEHFAISVKMKRRLNRYVREKLKFKNIPHPEADNKFERLRSRIICFLKMKRLR